MTCTAFPRRSCSTASRSWSGRGTGSTRSWPAPCAGRSWPRHRSTTGSRRWPPGCADTPGSPRPRPGSWSATAAPWSSCRWWRPAARPGVITAEQVAVMAKVTRPEQLSAAADQGVDLAEVDAVLAETAATRQHGQLGRVVGHYLARLDPDGPEPDPTEGRSLTLARHSDGTVALRGQLDAVGGEKLAAALESFVQAGRPAAVAAHG